MSCVDYSVCFNKIIVKNKRKGHTMPVKKKLQFSTKPTSITHMGNSGKDKDTTVSTLGPHSRVKIKSCNMSFLQYAKKDFIIHTLLTKKWTSRSKTDLSRHTAPELIKKFKYAIEDYATIQELQQIEEHILRDKQKREETRDAGVETSRKHKEECLNYGKKYLNVNSIVYVYDDAVTLVNGRAVKTFTPIQVRVVNVSSDFRVVTIEFMFTQKWYEAGGHPVYRGQQMKFKFDSITCKWLREGLTAEVVRTIGSGNKSIYFELSCTKQFLVFDPRAKQ